MTSDFDNDEIQDSAFPVDFNDDTTSLDLYGVWVKSGPRDAALAADKTPSPTVKSDFSAEMPDYSDISLLPDLPDFSGLEETETEEKFEAESVSAETVSLDDGTITFEEILPEFSSVDDLSADGTDIAPPTTTERAATETVSESEFDTIDTDSFFDMTEEAAAPSESPFNSSFDSSFDSSEIIFEDISGEELEVSPDAPKRAVPAKTAPIQEPTESRVFETVDLFEIDEPLAAEISPDEADTHDETETETDELPEFSDSPEFDLDDSFGTDFISSDSETFELDEPTPLSADANDLDSFVNDFNESGGTPAEEKDRLFAGLDPVDIDLDFDESFIADAEKIKSTGSSVTESEFKESEFGVELIEETPDTSFPDFDTSFGADSDGGTVSEAGSASADTQLSSDLQETDEFDDLLDSLDRSPSPVQAAKPAEIVQKKLYDLSVGDEENEEIIDIPVIKDYNGSASGADGVKSVASALEGFVSPDFDDISAVEQELNDLTPDTGEETVVANDKSTQLLMMIADELSSIKKELSTLKNEIAGYKASGTPSEQAPAVVGIDDTDNSGFFNDDDTDETIALTGDELNNILITADFTEEKSEEMETAAVPEETAEINFEPTGEPAGFGSFSADIEDSDIPDTLPDSIFEIPDLDISIPVEPSHVNRIEDDISYLEGSDLSDTVLDDLVIDEPELEIIDFDDEKLEEPQLDEFNIDLSAMDSAFPPEQEVSIPADFGMMDEPVAEEPEIEEPLAEEPVAEEPAHSPAARTEEPKPAPATGIAAMPVDLKDEIKSVLAYMDQLLESLPEEKIEEFARSEHFEVYRKLFEELGIS